MEILYKAKRKDTGEWVYGYYYKGYSGANYIIQIKEDGRSLEMDVEVIPETVCRYIGREDKNGKKIFENDILENHTVCWDKEDCKFFLNHNYLDHINLKTHIHNVSILEITGNIHDKKD